MKRILTAVMAGLIGFGLSAADGVKFATGEWEPYTGQKMESYGLVTELVTAACKAGDLKAEYDFFPWKRAEQNVEEGTHFATFPYQSTKERTAKFFFSDSLVKSSNGILLHKGNPKTAAFAYSKPEDLKGFKVGTLAGSDAVNIPLKKAGAEVDEVQAVEQNLKKLEIDRLDSVIDDRPVLFLAIKKYCGSDAQKLSTFYFTDKGFGDTTDYKLMVSMKYPNAKALLEKFNAGLKAIKASGEYQKILKKYGM